MKARYVTRSLALAVGAVVGFPMVAGANTITWGNTGTDWATPGDWVGGTAPGSSDIASLPAVASASKKNPVIAASTTVSVAGLTIDNSNAVYGITGGTNGDLQLGSSGLTVTGAASSTLSPYITLLGADQIWDIDTGASVTMSRPVASAGGGTFALTKTGAGTLNLNMNAGTGGGVRHGANNINDGTVTVAPFALGDGLTTVNNSAILQMQPGQYGGTLPQIVLNNTATLLNQTGGNGSLSTAPQIGAGANATLQGSTVATDRISMLTNISGGGAGTNVTISGNGIWLASSSSSTATYTGSWTINSGTFQTEWGRATFGAGTNPIYLNGGTISSAHGGGATGDVITQPITVGANSTVQSDSYYTAVNHNPTGNFTFGTLSIGAYTLTANINPNNAGLTTGNSDLIFGATTLTGNATFNVVNPTYNGGANTMTLDLGAVSGVGESLTKTGTGILRLSGTAHSYSGDTNVNAGTLALQAGGSLPNSPAITVAGGATLDLSALTSSFTLAAGHSLSGAGAVLQNLSNSNGKVLIDNGKLAGSLVLNGTVAGSGSIDPGDSPGILTADQVNPTSGLSFNFEFTTSGPPTYANPTASGNDLLHLTDATTPFTTSLTAANAVNVYFDLASLGSGDYQGGFFTDQADDFLSSINNATFSYYLSDPNGAYSYNGVKYDLLDPSKVTVSTVAATANFGAGAVNGRIADFAVSVPEPASLALVGAGGLALLIRRRRREM